MPGRSLRFTSSRLGRLGLALAAASLMISTVHGQITSGSISGTVLDASNAVIEDVIVTAVEEGTSTSQRAETNELGIYWFPGLRPGTYSLEFVKPGFEIVTVPPTRLSASQSLKVDQNLKVNPLTTSVEVTVELPGETLETGNSSIQQTLIARLLQETPLTSSSTVPIAARNQARYAWFSPAVVRVPGQNEMSANGHRGRDNYFSVDSVDNNDNSVNLPALFLPPEAISEFHVQVAAMSAEFGNKIGAQINVVTKGGTNSLHGELWDFTRTSALEPLSLQDRKTGRQRAPRLINHQFGADLGGPIVPGKTFFFGIFQGNLQRQAPRTLTSAVSIPTQAGYAALLTAPLRPTPTPQSASSRQVMLDKLSFLPEVYPQIANFTTTSTEFVNGTPVEVGTFFPVLAQNQDLWYVGGRVDHHFSGTEHLSYRLHLEDRNTPLAASNLSFGERWAADSTYTGQNHAISYTKVLSPRFINEARFAYTRLNPSFVERDPISPTLKISNLSLIIGGLESFPQGRLEQSYQFQNVSTYLVSRHSLKFGIDFTRAKLLFNSASHSKGTWAFSSLETFLNNTPTSLTQLVAANSRYSFTHLKQSYFVQDDIKVTPNFTANIGLRYETSGMPLGLFGATAADALNALVPGEAKRDTNNWGPRVGFTYTPSVENGFLGRVLGAGKSAVRAGFGIGYDGLAYSFLANSASNYPRNSPNAVTNADDLIDVFPGSSTPNASTPVLSSTTTFVNFLEETQLPTSHFWNLSFQRQLDPGYFFEIAYTGSRSYHLPRQGQANPGILSQEKAEAVIAGCTEALGSCEDPEGFDNSPARLNPNWASRTLLEYTGQSEYHGGYVRLDRRFSPGLRFGISYTWSANLSDSEDMFNDSGSSDGGIAGSSPQVPQNFLDRRNEWSRSAFDRPHRLAFNYTYQIPWFANSHPFLQQVFSGWQLSGFTDVQSGQPFTIRVGVDALGSGSGAGARPNYNPNGIIVPDPATGNLRTFRIPLDGSGIVSAPHVVTDPTTGKISFLKNSMPNGGNLGRNTFRGPGFSNTNLSLMKRFTLPGEAQLQIRGDFLNAFNHDNFPNPDGSMSSASFGNQVFVPITDARYVLLGAKIAF